MTRLQRLTPDIAARVPPYVGPPLEPGDGIEMATEADHCAALDRLLTTRPDTGPVWLFAYGSLIWKPTFVHQAALVARLHGWHRSFCLGWMRSFRGCPDRPGLMMALDRGGQCTGVAFRLPDADLRDHLLGLIRRELPFKDSGLAPRWLRGRTADGPLTMLGFPVRRGARGHVPDRTEAETVDMIAACAGPQGTMAEYLQQTVAHLEQRGIHDRFLWRLQDQVAARLGG